MRVNIDEIKEAGLRRSWDVAREVLDEMVAGERAGYRAGAALHVEAKLEKIERRVFLEGHARASLACECGRCLAPVSVDVPVDFSLTLVPADEYADAASTPGAAGRERVGGSFDPGEAEEERFDGKVIDIDPILREQLLLALPGYPVCKETCRGLCPSCGANLNERDCGCDTHVPDPRWAKLKDLKL